MNASAGNAESDKPLNIVYIMTDDHTRQMMSSYDKSHVSTPNLDRISEEGVRFTNAFVANSISGPSRACLLTGKHSHKNGKKDNITQFDGNQQTVQQLLKEGGYQTAMIGKWHLDSTPRYFDFWEILPGQGSYYNPDFITPQGKVTHKGYVTNIITDLGIDWLNNKRDKDKPFVMFLHHKAAHRNWMADTPHLAEYEDKTFTLPSLFKKRGDVDALVQNIDFAPTILDIAGLEIPDDIQGESLLPLLNRDKAPDDWRKSLYYHYYEYPGEHSVKRHYGIRTGR